MDSWMWKHEKNNHLNRKTLKLFKPKFFTLSVRNTAMLIASETCLNAMNIMPQFDYTSKLLFLEKKKKKKNNGLTRVLGFTLLSPTICYVALKRYKCPLIFDVNFERIRNPNSVELQFASFF